MPGVAAGDGIRSPRRLERPPEPVEATSAGDRAGSAAERPLEPVDARVAATATGQHGIVTHAQLLRCGLTRHAIAHRVRTGRLIRLSRGVYAVGHLGLGWSAQRLAAVLGCGRAGVLSHADAAVGARLLEPVPGPIHVTCRSGHRLGPEGVIVHRAALAREDVVHLGPIPMTAPARTLLDLAAAGDERQLEFALREAQARRLVRPAELLRRCDRRRGARLLRAVLEDEPGLTRSEAERRLLRLLRRAGLPAPRTNVRIGRFEVDLLFADERLIVEVDGFAFHASRSAFERDRDRDAALTALGYRVMRFTWRTLVERPELVVARIAAALAEHRPAA